MDRETVITHLQIIHTWAEFARERDLQFFTAKHLEDIAQWADDAIAILNEQEHKDKMFHALEEDWKRLKALLKEKEAAEPITEHHLFLCPVCKKTLFREQKFCHECGKRIEWESRRSSDAV